MLATQIVIFIYRNPRTKGAGTPAKQTHYSARHSPRDVFTPLKSMKSGIVDQVLITTNVKAKKS